MGGAPYRSAKEGVGALLSFAAFNHERVPMSCLQRLNALKAHNWTNNNVRQNHQQLRSYPDGTQHSL